MAAEIEWGTPWMPSQRRHAGSHRSQARQDRLEPSGGLALPRVQWSPRRSVSSALHRMIRPMQFVIDVCYAIAALATAVIWLPRMIATGKIRTDWRGRFGRTP